MFCGKFTLYFSVVFLSTVSNSVLPAPVDNDYYMIESSSIERYNQYEPKHEQKYASPGYDTVRSTKYGKHEYETDTHSHVYNSKRVNYNKRSVNGDTYSNPNVVMVLKPYQARAHDAQFSVDDHGKPNYVPITTPKVINRSGKIFINYNKGKQSLNEELGSVDIRYKNSQDNGDSVYLNKRDAEAYSYSNNDDYDEDDAKVKNDNRNGKQESVATGGYGGYSTNTDVYGSPFDNYGPGYSNSYTSDTYGKSSNSIDDKGSDNDSNFNGILY